MLFTTEWLGKLFTSQRGKIDETIVIEKVNTDSRVEAPQSLFIPIIGDNFNGHTYLEQAISGGAVAVVWDEQETLPASIPADFPVFFTQDTLTGLQQLATCYRNEINPIVIGITGSNGKTTTKDLVAAMVKTTFRSHYTLGNFNNHIGLPLTILAMPRDTEVLVLEMGMSGVGEIDLLSQIARPDYAIITNIGESHIEFLGSREGIAQAKLEIRNGLKENGLLIIDGDEPLLNELHTNELVISCGFHAENNKQISSTDITVEGTKFSLSNGETYSVPLFGRHHAKNACFALLIAEKLGISIAKQKSALLSLEHTSMRFEMLEAKNGAVVVNDSYNASPTSMTGAIEVIKEMEGFSEKVLVLGDILELGDFSEDMHRSIAKVISEPITHLYTYGEKAALISEAVTSNEKGIMTNHYSSKEALVKGLDPLLNEHTIILFKASRGLAFESMVNEILTDSEK